MIDNNKIEVSEMSLNDLKKIEKSLVTEFDDFWNTGTLENELKNKNSYYIVAKINDEIVGFAGIKIVLDEADIMNIVTKKDLRNLGIGSALFEAIINYSKNNGINKLTLEVNEKNLSAIHLYEKFGFLKIAKRQKYYNGTDTALIMQLNLDVRHSGTELKSLKNETK